MKDCLLFQARTANSISWAATLTAIEPGFLAIISTSLSHRYGLQIDGVAGGSNDGAHLFWRDPSKGLVDIDSSAAHVENVTQDWKHYTVAFKGHA